MSGSNNNHEGRHAQRPTTRDILATSTRRYSELVGEQSDGEGGDTLFFDAASPEDDLVAFNEPATATTLTNTSPREAVESTKLERVVESGKDILFLRQPSTAQPSTKTNTTGRLSRLIDDVSRKDESKSGDQSTTVTTAAPPQEPGDQPRPRLKLSLSSSVQSNRRRRQSSAFRFIKDAGLVVSTEVMNEGAKVFRTVKMVVLKLWIPCLSIAAVLYYGLDNPKGFRGASISWWILFLGVRLVVTLFVALLLEHIVTDLLSIRSRVSQRILGPLVALCIVQANGWAATLILWAVLNLSVLHGSSPFVQHWLYWQNIIGLFNDDNSAGNVLDAEGYTRLLAAAIVVGVLVTIKRVAFAFNSEKRFYERYSSEFSSITKRVEMVRKVAVFAAEHVGRGSFTYRRDSANLANSSGSNASPRKDGVPDEERRKVDEKWAAVLEDVFVELANTEDDDDDDDDAAAKSSGNGGGRSSARRVQKDERTKRKVAEVIGDSDGTDDFQKSKKVNVTANDILNLRQAVANLDDRYPFSPAFGVAKTRHECVTSALNLYDRLLLLEDPTETRSDDLSMSCLSAVIADADGIAQFDQLKAFVRVFRPDRNGRLTADTFAKCCLDAHNKIQQFRQTVSSSTQIDKEFEKFVGFFFYIVLTVIVLAIMKVALLPLALTMSAVVLSIAFLFGTSAARCFEGILTVFVERPFNVGDRISVIPVDRKDDRSTQRGAHQWSVSKVTLFKTTLIYTETGEVATVPNAMLASFKIINANLNTPKTIIKIWLKFDIDIPFSKVKIFKQHVEQYMKDRPNEWGKVDHFRSSGVDQQLGYIEFVFGLVHREKWQALNVIKTSEMNMYAFCNELAKAMNMRYDLPPQPILLRTTGNNELVNPSTYDDGSDELDPATLKKAIALFEDNKKMK